MKQIGARGFESLGEALAMTTAYGFMSYVVAREAYYKQDVELVVSATLGLVGTCILTYNTLALSLYGDTSNDYTGA